MAADSGAPAPLRDDGRVDPADGAEPVANRHFPLPSAPIRRFLAALPHHLRPTDDMAL